MSAATPDPASIVAALREVPGVADAGLDPDGEAGEVLRLDLMAGVDEADVALAAGRLLRERFGLGVDAAAVTLCEEVFDLAPEVERLQVVRAGREATATVGMSDPTGSGEASGPATGRGVLRAVAEATLAAAAGSRRSGGGSPRLEALELGDLDGVRTVRVVVHRDGNDGAAGLPVVAVGTCVVRQDPRQAVVRAVLAAVGARTGR